LYAKSVLTALLWGEIELGKVSVGLEVANSLAVALGMRFSELIREAE
jgi:hypothetical protein